ncbi:NACHT, LRR and PYD domains-containing protein 12-like [Macrotis lagotis]|uniref:NACHT, LRR and PYD domains-containing protein 12-like n=1 Tax=Macrotis lagotis TaxID=92651 RepID=UPI003D69BCDC
MVETVRARLLWHLEHLTKEELEKFKLVYLVDHIRRGRLEGANHVQVADLLVSSLGEQKAWELALSIWEKMGLRELCERARKENFESVPAPVLPDSSDERNKYRERMREKFRFMREKNSRPGDHELFHLRFTQLLLLLKNRYKEEKEHELMVRGWKHAEVMEKLGMPINVSDLFDYPKKKIKRNVQPCTVVLQGAAGIGKSTLANKIMLDWAEGKLYQKRFDYVFYFSCRELNSLGEKIMSFADLIAFHWPFPQAPMAQIISQPKRLLFIIDGLDELKFSCNEHRYDLCKDWKQQRPVPILLSSLLRKFMFPEASLLLTTRLTALGKFLPLLENPRHVEILGFSENLRKQYFCKFFKNEDLGKKVFSLVKSNVTLFTMCSVPLMNWIVCTCLKQQMEKGQEPVQALKTTTSLYMCYLSNLITSNDKNIIPQHLKGLCQLAAEGIWGRKLLFEEEDLRRHDLEAADVSAFLDMSIFQKDSDCENCYSFIHLSFQEFFGALFYVVNTNKEGVKSPDSSIPDIKKLLEECSRDDASFVVLVLRFLFGFLNAETEKELERKFRCRMSPEIKSQLLQWIEGEIKRDFDQSWFPKTQLPGWYFYLYETQDAEFVSQALTNIQEIEVRVFRHYEAQSAVFCIQHCPGARRICFSCDFALPNGIWQDVLSLVSKNQNLRELKLYLGVNESCWDVTDDETGFPNCQLENLSVEPGPSFLLENLCEKLRNPNCKLEKLVLKSLYLKDVFFEDDDTELPRKALGKNKWQLHTLWFGGKEERIFGEGALRAGAISGAGALQEGIRICSARRRRRREPERASSARSLARSLRCPRGPELRTRPARSPPKKPSEAPTPKRPGADQKAVRTRGLPKAGKPPGRKPRGRPKKLEKEEEEGISQESSEEEQSSSLLVSRYLIPLDDDDDNTSSSSLENPLAFFSGGLRDSCRTISLSGPPGLSNCFLIPTYFQNLFFALLNNQSLKNLDLSRNSFEETGIEFLDKDLEDQNCKIEEQSYNERLNLFENSYKGMRLELFKALENPNCKLEKLSLSDCFLTTTCSQNFFSALGRNESLKNLDLSRNSFMDEAIEILCKALENPNCKIETLSLETCDLTPRNFQNLFSAISSNESLKNLDLSRNSFEERGIELLCQALGSQNCKIEELSLSDCFLTTTCSQNFFSALGRNESLKNLDLSRNSFMDEAIEILCKALENPNCKIETLSLVSCKLTPTGSQNFFSALSSNESLKTLDVSENSFEERGIQLLCKALGNQNCKIEELRLNFGDLPLACLQDFFHVISNSKRLKTLDLSYYLSDDERLKLLCETLEKQDCKLQTLKLGQFKLSAEAVRTLTNLKSRKCFHIIWKGYKEKTKLFDYL